MGQLRAVEVAHEGGGRPLVRPEHDHVSGTRKATRKIPDHIEYDLHSQPPDSRNEGRQHYHRTS